MTLRSRVRDLLRRTGDVLLEEVATLVGLAGAGTLLTGVALLSVPAALITGGVLGLGAALLLARGERKT